MIKVLFFNSIIKRSVTLIDAFQLTDYEKDYYKLLVIVMWKRIINQRTIL